MQTLKGTFPLVIPQSPLQLWEYSASHSCMLFRRQFQYGISYEREGVLDVAFYGVRKMNIEPYIPDAVIRPFTGVPRGEKEPTGRQVYFSLSGMSYLTREKVEHWILCENVSWAWFDAHWDAPSPLVWQSGETLDYPGLQVLEGDLSSS